MLQYIKSYPYLSICIKFCWQTLYFSINDVSGNCNIFSISLSTSIFKQYSSFSSSCFPFFDVEFIGNDIDQKFSVFGKGGTWDNCVSSEVVYEGRDLEDANGDIEGEAVKFDKGSFKEADDGRREEERPRGGGWKEVEVEVEVEEEADDGRREEERPRGGGWKEVEGEVGEGETVDDEEGSGNEEEWINGGGKAIDWRVDK